MKSVLFTYCLLLLPFLMTAQDLTSIFLEEIGADSTLTRVTISPKMMEEILKSDTGKSEEILDIISNLKSMQILSSQANGESYFQQVLKVVEEHSNRFEPYHSYTDEHENHRIIVRKRRGTIVELIMLTNEEERFTMINFTGKIKPEFISTLTQSFKCEHSL